MIDRRLILSVCAAFAGLTCGLLAVVFDQPVLGVVAGFAGVVTAIGAAAIAARTKGCEERLAGVTEERQRLRRELDALAAIFTEEATRRHHSEPPPRPTTPEPVFDSVSGLLEEQFFGVLVQQRVAAARRQLQPVSVVIFELDGLNSAQADTRDQALGVLGEVVRRTLRECDTACRIGNTMAAAVLEDTTESGAVWAAERVRGTLHGSPVGDSLTISAGIACYPSHALNSRELMEMARRALGTARARGRDHVEIAQLD